MISSSNPGIVALYAQANAPFNRLLTNHANFTVSSIAPTSDPVMNTRAEIVVDRTIAANGSTVTIPAGEERFFNRSVEFHRFDLKDILTAQLNGTGHLVIAGWDNAIVDQHDMTDAFIAGVPEINFTADDVYLVHTPTVGTYVVVAKEDSLGYVGRATVAIIA